MRIKLGHPMLLKEISYAMGGRISCVGNPLIEYITTDSRVASKGDLYIPIKGSRFDGEDFVKEASNKGCYSVSSQSNLAHIKVGDCSESLLNLANHYNKNLPNILYRIGITGSVGKTTTKEFSKLLLSKRYRVHASEANFNNHIGLPLSILSAPKESEILLMEIGMNHIGEISRLSKCLCPDIALITNIGTSHIGNLGSREMIAKAKLEIKDGMTGGKLCVPTEEILLKECKNKVEFSLNNPNSDYYLSSKKNNVSIYKKGRKYADAVFAFSENHLKACLLSSCAIAIESGVSSNLLKEGISNISVENTRQKVVTWGGYCFLNDCYNASIESIIASFDLVRNINSTNKKSLLLGDVLELGIFSEEIHSKIGELIPKELFEHVFLFGNYAKFTANGALKNNFPINRIHINEDINRPDISALQIKAFCKKGELILLKGSRGIRIERILDYFKEGENGD